MTMPRPPGFEIVSPSHEDLPALGEAVGYMLHGNEQPIIAGLPVLVERFVAPLASHAAAWSTLGYASTITNNGGASGGWCLQVNDDDEDEGFDKVLSMYGRAAGEQIVVVQAFNQAAAPGAVSHAWCYGKNTASSMWGLSFTSAGLPNISHRARDDTGVVNTVLDLVSGSALSAFIGQGAFQIALGIKILSATSVDVELRAGNGTLSSVYTKTAYNMMGAAGTALPGRSGGTTVANFGGVTIGARHTGSSFDAFAGLGAANLARYAAWQAKDYAAWRADRVSDVLADAILRQGDFNKWLLQGAA